MSKSAFVLVSSMFFGAAGCSSAKVTNGNDPARGVAANSSAFVDPLENPIIDKMITNMSTMSCSKMINTDAGVDGTEAAEAFRTLIKNPRRLNFVYRKLKAINPEFRLIEVPSDDVPDTIRARSTEAANFKVYLKNQWMLVIVHGGSNLFCNQSSR